MPSSTFSRHLLILTNAPSAQSSWTCFRAPLKSSPSIGLTSPASLMALFHCMVRHGTVRYGSLLGGFPLGTVPGTWYFFSTTSVEVPSSRTVTKTWRVNSADHWMAGENRLYCVTELATRDPPLPLYPLDLNQHSQRRIWRNFCLNKRTFLHQPQNSSVVVCWRSSDVPLVDSRGADPVRAWWRDAEGKALCI